MDRFRIDEVYGIHNDPGAPLGFFQTCSGPNMAAADDFTIKILGQGGHAAEPEETIDPLSDRSSASASNTNYFVQKFVGS